MSSKFDAESLTSAQSDGRYVRYDLVQSLSDAQKTNAIAALGLSDAANISIDTDPDGVTVLVISPAGTVTGGGGGDGGGGDTGSFVVTNNNDGTVTVSGTNITDNGDGTATVSNANVVDNGDGTATVTVS